MCDNLEDFKIPLEVWRTSLDTWGLGINVGKTKILGLLGEAQMTTRNVKWLCGVCSKGVAVNSIVCQTCNFWINKRCLGVKETLKKENMFRCKKCKGENVPTDSLNTAQVHVNQDTFEAVPPFQYLGDVIGIRWLCRCNWHTHHCSMERL